MHKITSVAEFDLLKEALTLKEYEPQPEHWIAAPVGTAIIKWGWAALLTVVFVTLQNINAPAFLWVRHSPNGRHTSTAPTICPRCLWAGQRRQCYHGYSEWEAVDECPRCGGEL